LGRPIRMYALIQSLIFAELILFAFPVIGSASEASEARRGPGPEPGWSTFLRGGYVHQFDTDIDDGGSFNANRLFIQGGVTYSPDYRRSVSFALGYGLEGYDFSGDTGFAALRPWENINSYRVSMLGGAELGGELRLEDEKGGPIAEENYETAGFGGISFNFRF
jgi:hypothetical protein